MAGKFLLCFHDFSVWNYQKVVPVLEELKDLTGRPFNVLVIPDTEKASSETIEGFKASLLKLREEGFELALHGYKHKAEFSQGRTYVGLIGMNLTHGEAEFAGLSKYESERLLDAGLDAWKALLGEYQPVAFVPPTWYSNAFLRRQVRERGMLFEDRFSLTTAAGKRFVSPVTSFAGIPNFLIKPAFRFGEIILKLPAGLPRIALHPVDFPARAGEVRDVIRTALSKGRELVRYSDL